MVIYIYVKILVTRVTVKKGHVTPILLPRRHAVLKSFKVVLGNSSPVF